MVQNFSIIITAEKGNQQSSAEPMGGMSTCKNVTKRKHCCYCRGRTF